MATPSSGAISLNELHVEAGGSSGSTVSLTDSDVRTMRYGDIKGATAQQSFSDYYNVAGFPETVSGTGASGGYYSSTGPGKCGGTITTYHYSLNTGWVPIPQWLIHGDLGDFHSGGSSNAPFTGTPSSGPDVANQIMIQCYHFLGFGSLQLETLIFKNSSGHGVVPGVNSINASTAVRQCNISVSMSMPWGTVTGSITNKNVAATSGIPLNSNWAVLAHSAGQVFGGFYTGSPSYNSVHHVGGGHHPTSGGSTPTSGWFPYGLNTHTYGTGRPVTITFT